MFRTSGSTSTKLALVVLALGAALLFASGAAVAQHDEHDDHGADAHTEQATDQHADDAHANDAHGAHGDAAHGSEHGDDAHHDAHHDDHGSIPHLQNLLIGWIAPLLPDSVAHNLEEFLNPIYALTVVLVLSLFFISLSRKFNARFPGRTQMAVEMIFGQGRRCTALSRSSTVSITP